MKHIEAFCVIVGGRAKAAAELGISPGQVSHLITGRRNVTFQIAQKIERITDGQISRKDLRPDIYG